MNIHEYVIENMSGKTVVLVGPLEDIREEHGPLIVDFSLMANVICDNEIYGEIRPIVNENERYFFIHKNRRYWFDLDELVYLYDIGRLYLKGDNP